METKTRNGFSPQRTLTDQGEFVLYEGALADINKLDIDTLGPKEGI